MLKPIPMERLRIKAKVMVGLTLFFGSLGCVSKSQQRAASTIKASEKIVADQFEKWRTGKANFFDLLSDDVIWTVAGRSPVSGVYHGKAEFTARSLNPIVDKFKSPLKPELISLSSDSAFVWLHFTAKTMSKANEVYENTYLWKLTLKDGKIKTGVAFLDTYELTKLMNTKSTSEMNKTIEETKDYIGMWITKDGNIRHELLPGNRYDEARGNRESAYQGSYKVTGNHIDYKDDTGFTADGEFKDGILYHGGMILYKKRD